MAKSKTVRSTETPQGKATARFWAKTTPGPTLPGQTTPCLLWTGAVKKPSGGRYHGGNQLPHGKFWYKGRVELAHRFAKATALNVEPETLPLIGHACDNPRCVRPDHLTLSTHSKNLQEAYDRGRRYKEGDEYVDPQAQVSGSEHEPRDHLHELSEWSAEQGRGVGP